MFCQKCLELLKIPLEELDFRIKSKKISQTLARFKYLFYLCTAIERETLKSNEDGPFVYRLVLKIFILARGVRFPHGLQPAEIAQLVEHNLAKVRVASSSLVFRSTFQVFASLAQLARARDL